MSKTIRRKSCKNTSDYYDWKDEVRNRQGAGDAYYHSDMPGRFGRWHGYNRPVKEFSDSNRRSETRKICHDVKVAQDVEELNIHADDKQSREDPWGWD